jgi:hypothetical protein
MHRGKAGAGSQNWRIIRISLGAFLFDEILLTENGSLMDWRRNPTRLQILENWNAVSDLIATFDRRTANATPAPAPAPVPPPALPSPGMPEPTPPFTTRSALIRPPSLEPDQDRTFDSIWNQFQESEEAEYHDYEFNFPGLK